MVGKKPLQIPEGVNVALERMGTWWQVSFSGPLGKIEVRLPMGVEVEEKDGKLAFTKKAGVEDRFLGLGFALSRNAAQGVSAGFKEKLEMQGVGYRAAKTADGLKLSLGFSHPVEFKIPEGVKAEVEADTKLTLSGIDKQLVAQTAANLRKLRPPEPYKGKGIRYEGEVVRRKLGKAAKAAVGGAAA
ncbi:MAG: 50S ribosomal protein L6 [Patescibacteria group bacterium]